MKKILPFFLSLIMISGSGFAENLKLDNQTSYPENEPKSKIAIQWASSAKEVKEGNEALLYGTGLKSDKMQVLNTQGIVDITIPDKAEYFRVLVWSKGQSEPNLVTNWVDIVPNKTYTLDNDHLIPAVLMSGTGC